MRGERPYRPLPTGTVRPLRGPITPPPSPRQRTRAALFVVLVFLLVDVAVPFDFATQFQYGGNDASGIVFGQPLFITTLIFVTGGAFAFLFGTWLGRVVSWQRRRWVGALADTTAVLGATLFPPLLVFLLVRYTEPLLRSVRRGLDIPVTPR